MFTLTVLLGLLSITQPAIFCTHNPSRPFLAWEWRSPGSTDHGTTSSPTVLAPSLREMSRMIEALRYGTAPCRLSSVSSVRRTVCCHGTRARGRFERRANRPQPYGCPQELLAETLSRRPSQTTRTVNPTITLPLAPAAASTAVDSNHSKNTPQPSANQSSSPQGHSLPMSTDRNDPTDGDGAESADTQNVASVKARLPRYFAQLGLSEAQRDDVLAVQTEFDTAVRSIELELQRLETERGERLSKLLSDSQQGKLDKLLRRRSTGR